ncbi:enterobacterial Ail/Lom domain protein [Escherichia coli 900105 (10e)]|nr:enterobacterial Ail/Lom domain protein [Escherichia coli 900105 (10e)]
MLTGSDDGRHSNTSLAGGLACSLTRPNPWQLILLMKVPASGDWRTDGFIVGVGYKF